MFLFWATNIIYQMNVYTLHTSPNNFKCALVECIARILQVTVAARLWKVNTALCVRHGQGLVYNDFIIISALPTKKDETQMNVDPTGLGIQIFQKQRR